jgi:hypothetical protein
MSTTAFRMASLSCLLLVFAACGDDANNGSGPGLSGGDAGNDAGGTPTNCPARCEAKASSCGLPSGQVESTCEYLCDSATAAQLTCLEQTSCAALNAGELCGIGAGKGGSNAGTGGSSSGKGGTGGSSSGKGGTGGSSSGKGGSSSSGCASTTPYCDGDVAKSCDDSSGFPVDTSTTCSNGCENGACKGKPKNLTLTCKLAKGSDVTSITTSSGGTASLFTLSADCQPSPSVNDSPDLDGLTPSSISPAPTGCTSSSVPGKVSVGSALNVISSMSADEPPGSTPCLDFMNEIKDSGVTFVYTNVPYLNGGTADELTIKIKP